jgi:uncharacterized protein (TIGR02145 family)
MSGMSTSDGIGTGVFTSTLTGLTASTLYYVRAYATNSVGTAYGNEVSFTTLAPPVPCPGAPSLTDIDGNTYATVQIGTQCWTQSNLKVSKYRNGDNIPTGLNNSQWSSTSTGAYAIYNNDAANDALYGKLYNWYAVNDSRGLCPTGWHVPSDAEWTTLTTFLGGESVAGDKMKSTATQPTPGGWIVPNTVTTNSSGFTGLPGGYRVSFSGGFTSLGSLGYWWSSSDEWAGCAWFRSLDYANAAANRFYNFHQDGFSVRCVMNVPATSLATISTSSPTVLSHEAASTGGDITDSGGGTIFNRGVAYGTSQSPTISGMSTSDGAGTGVFTSTLTGLTASTLYYVRAYAINSVGTSYGDELSFTTSPIPIGTNYAGGIVFYVDSTGQHGLVCAPTDQGSFQWGCLNTNISGTSTAFGTGMANTLAIVNGCSQRPIAASVCNDLVLNGYDDWYLPSLDELSLMYQNLWTQNLGNFQYNYQWYWSSSQSNSGNAWVVHFINGSVSVDHKNYDGNRVRVVRAF